MFLSPRVEGVPIGIRHSVLVVLCDRAEHDGVLMANVGPNTYRPGSIVPTYWAIDRPAGYLGIVGYTPNLVSTIPTAAES